MICPWHERLQLSSTPTGRNTLPCAIGFGLYRLASHPSVNPTRVRTKSTSRIKRLERVGGIPRLSAMKSRDCLTYLAAVLVVLQQGPCLREIRLQRPKFVIRVSSSTPRVMKVGTTAVPAR